MCRKVCPVYPIGQQQRLGNIWSTLGQHLLTSKKKVKFSEFDSTYPIRLHFRRSGAQSTQKTTFETQENSLSDDVLLVKYDIRNHT